MAPERAADEERPVSAANTVKRTAMTAQKPNSGMSRMSRRQPIPAPTHATPSSVTPNDVVADCLTPPRP